MEEKQVENVQKQKLICGNPPTYLFRGVHGRGVQCCFSELCDSCFDFFSHSK